MDPTIGLPPRAFEEASVEISTGELGVSVSHANTNTSATHVMAHILDLHVPRSSPSQSNTMSEIQNVSTTPQNPNEVKDKLLPTPISIQHLKTALSGHPDQNFVSQFCNNFKFGVHIGFRANGPQGFQGICQRLSLTQILFLQIFLLFLQTFKFFNTSKL